jgi:hypothetical protein
MTLLDEPLFWSPFRIALPPHQIPSTPEAGQKRPLMGILICALRLVFCPVS